MANASGIESGSGSIAASGVISLVHSDGGMKLASWSAISRWSLTWGDQIPSGRAPPLIH